MKVQKVKFLNGWFCRRLYKITDSEMCPFIKIAGAALFAPMINPYERSMTKEEKYTIWENWVKRRKLMYFLARRFPYFLSYFYHQSFLSGKHGQIEKTLCLSLGKRVSIHLELQLNSTETPNLQLLFG